MDFFIFVLSFIEGIYNVNLKLKVTDYNSFLNSINQIKLQIIVEFLVGFLQKKISKLEYQIQKLEKQKLKIVTNERKLFLFI